MTKRQMIDEILSANPSARPAFLAPFSQEDIQAYLQHLQVLRQPRLTGDAKRFEKYFAKSANPPATATYRAPARPVPAVVPAPAMPVRAPVAPPVPVATAPAVPARVQLAPAKAEPARPAVQEYRPPTPAGGNEDSGVFTVASPTVSRGEMIGAGAGRKDYSAPLYPKHRDEPDEYLF